jgi:hypothetical protein
MLYASGEAPMIGDRISDTRGSVGTVTHIIFDVKGPGELTIRWDDGIVGIRYLKTEAFTLISRARPS